MIWPIHGTLRPNHNEFNDSNKTNDNIMKLGPFQRILQPGDIVVQERDGVSSKAE